MNKIKVVIVDDETMSRKSLEHFCNTHEHLECAGVFENAEDALEFFKNHSADLMLLDVELPGQSGIDLLSQLSVVPLLIFTTSKPEYAYEAFEFEAIDFLKKPITPARFKTAISKVLDKTVGHPTSSGHAAGDDGIFVRENGKLVRLKSDDILYFENVGDYVRVKTPTSSHIIYGALKAVDEKLRDPRFLKVHRSYIINLSKIKDIEEGSVVIDKMVIPVSRAHRNELLNRVRVL